jgi:hypothetical protein
MNEAMKNSPIDVWLITSGRFGEEVLKEHNDNQKSKGVLVYCGYPKAFEQLKETYNKVLQVLDKDIQLK